MTQRAMTGFVVVVGVAFTLLLIVAGFIWPTALLIGGLVACVPIGVIWWPGWWKK